MKPFLKPIERLILIRDGLYGGDPDCRRRVAALLAMDRGLPVPLVARTVNCHRMALYSWRNRYLEHRDVAVLRDGRRAETARRLRALMGDRVPRLRALLARLPAGPGRLPLTDDERRQLATNLREASDASVRRQAAMVLALDRGASLRQVALAAGCDQRTVISLRRRLLAQRGQ